MFREDFGDRIQRAARRKHISQKELARRVFTTPSTISNYCVGRSQPPLETLANIARELGVSTDYLFGLTECGEPHSGETEYLSRVRGQLDDLSGEIKKISKKIEHIRNMLGTEGNNSD